jgi:hypothetical protein
MEQYPKIPRFGEVDHSGHVLYVFDKLDGSNVRAEWTRKGGFDKFGRRKALLDNANPFLPEARDLILAQYGDDLERVFKKARWSKVTVFFEFFGPSSFAGVHLPEPHTVTLLDVRPFKQGILPPREFLKLFGHLEHPALLHQGKMEPEVVQAVRESTLKGMTFEGVVCKGQYIRKLGRPLMFKLKSQAWIGRVTELHKGNEKLLKELL